jgi:hypothetical protein
MSDSEKSDIPKVEIPKFSPSIPAYLLESMDNDNQRDNAGAIKFLLEQVSIIKQNNEWQNRHIQDIYDYTRKINGQVISLTEFKIELLKQMSVEHSLAKEREKTNQQKIKLYRALALVMGLVVYPLFLTTWKPGGFIFDIFRSIW